MPDDENGTATGTGTYWLLVVCDEGDDEEEEDEDEDWSEEEESSESAKTTPDQRSRRETRSDRGSMAAKTLMESARRGDTNCCV